MDLRDEIRLAQNARRNSYLKTEDLSVGAVVKTKNGKKYTGCNIQCNPKLEYIEAEKVAILKAVSEGEKEFEYIVIVAGKKGKEPEKYFPSKSFINFIKLFVDNKFKIYIIYENKIEGYEIGKII